MKKSAYDTFTSHSCKCDGEREVAGKYIEKEKEREGGRDIWNEKEKYCEREGGRERERAITRHEKT